MFEPEYRGPDGLTGSDPLSLLGSHPVVDLGALALLFTGPALLGEFMPR